jgi:hypothetical protein
MENIVADSVTKYFAKALGRVESCHKCHKGQNRAGFGG